MNKSPLLQVSTSSILTSSHSCRNACVLEEGSTEEYSDNGSQFWSLVERWVVKLRRRLGSLIKRFQWKQPTPENASFHPFYKRHLGFHLWSGETRRGWVEDGRLTLELAIAGLFSFIRYRAQWLLFLPYRPTKFQTESDNPSPPDRSPVTAEHFICAAQYPAEAYDVETSDGYIITLHRIARADAKRTVFFQHGLMDTSLGWVSSGVTDSLAFSIWDQGCDVWLGNTRCNPPRRHKNATIARDIYWQFSLNELGMEDIRAQVDFIHEVKCRELSETEAVGKVALEDEPEAPYSLCVIGHSLGAAAVLIFLITTARSGGRHHADRVILMSPAGFHHHYPNILIPLKWLLPPCIWFMERVIRLKGAPLTIPGSFTRLCLLKLLQDAVQYPATREFLRRVTRWLMNGDVSPWEFVMQLPHYAVASMPGFSVRSALHLIQIVKTGRFQLYDYGSAPENQKRYQQPSPPVISAEYGRINVPVDIIAGKNDGVIPPECVRLHEHHMCEQGVAVTYKEFEYGHLEFSHAVPQHLQSYVLDRIFV